MYFRPHLIWGGRVVVPVGGDGGHLGRGQRLRDAVGARGGVRRLVVPPALAPPTGCRGTRTGHRPSRSRAAAHGRRPWGRTATPATTASRCFWRASRSLARAARSATCLRAWAAAAAATKAGPPALLLQGRPARVGLVADRGELGVVLDLGVGQLVGLLDGLGADGEAGLARLVAVTGLVPGGGGGDDSQPDAGGHGGPAQGTHHGAGGPAQRLRTVGGGGLGGRSVAVPPLVALAAVAARCHVCFLQRRSHPQVASPVAVAMWLPPCRARAGALSNRT